MSTAQEMARGARIAPALQHKIAPPEPARDEIAHPDLIEHVRSLRAARLVALTAPAGYGKTSALRQVHAAFALAGTKVAWLTLDAADTDVARFTAALWASLGAVLGVSQDGEQDGQGGGRDLRSSLPDAAPFVLVIDELDALRGTEAMQELRILLDLFPPGACLVTGSRQVPEFPLARLRARGQLVEIGQGELAFSLDRARAFLARQNLPPLPEADLLWLHRRTEGWIAGLRLAAIALRRHPDPRRILDGLARAEGPLADYLAEEIFSHAPPAQRRFLTRTSILRELDPQICAVLVPDMDADDMLRELMAGGFMLSRSEGPEPGYRVHPILAEFLRARLAREQGQPVTELHALMAGWFESRGRPIPAIEHWLDSGDSEAALRLIARHGEALYLQGRLWMLARWFERLAPEALWAEPAVAMLRLWVICFTSGPHLAEAEIARLPGSMRADAVVAAHLNALGPMLHLLQERHDASRSEGLEALRRLPSGQGFADSQLLQALAISAMIAGSDAEIRELLQNDLAFGEGNPIAVMYREVLFAQRDLFGGHMSKAAARLRIALGAIRASEAAERNHAWPGILSGVAAYEANDAARARSLLQAGLQGSREAGLVDHVITAYRLLSRLSLEAGEVERAFVLLAELEQFGRQRQLRRVRNAAGLERARLHLMQGNLRAAAIEAERAEDRETGAMARNLRLVGNDLDTQEICRLRLEIHAGDPAQAVLEAERQGREARAAGRNRRALLLDLLRALALARSGGSAPALRALRDALKFAQAEGFFRIVLDEGAPMARLVADLAANPAAGDPALRTYVARLAEAFAPHLAEENRDLRLTATEVRVLALLSEGQSNKLMARSLAVSENTIRAHLRSINAKLGASNRLEAVSIARRHRLA